MGVLQRFERRLEGLVEGAFARAFKGRVEPVEIANALDREAADKAAIVSAGRTLVPNDYVVELGPTDYERIGPYADPLGRELATMLRESAEENSWSFVGPVTVLFEEVSDLETGMFRVRSGVSSEAEFSGGVQHTAGARDAAEPAQQTRHVEGAFPGNPRLVFSVGGEATAGSVEARGGQRQFVLTRPVTVIGRGHDADLRLDDPGISRQHLEVEVRDDGEVWVTDLGSTNGTTIDGAAMSGPTQLGPMQRITIGSTVMVFARDEQRDDNG